VNFTVATKDPVALVTPLSERQAVTVPIARAGRALYLLMGAEFLGKMLGWSGWVVSDMTDKPEQFRLIIRYASGAPEEEIPYCLDKHE
jgi:hypothetical protein